MKEFMNIKEIMNLETPLFRIIEASSITQCDKIIDFSFTKYFNQPRI